MSASNADTQQTVKQYKRLARSVARTCTKCWQRRSSWLATVESRNADNTLFASYTMCDPCKQKESAS